MGEATGGVLRRGPDRILGGVCAGLAAYFGVDPLLVRVVFVILALVPGFIGIIVYLVLWFLMEPPQGTPPSTTRSVSERFRSMGDDIREDFRTGFSRSQASGTPPPSSGDSPHPDPPPQGGREKFSGWGPSYRNRPPGLWFGIILIVLGAYFLLTNLGIFSNVHWEIVWPVILIALGLLLLLRRR
jgi:phage shock protein C